MRKGNPMSKGPPPIRERPSGPPRPPGNYLVTAESQVVASLPYEGSANGIGEVFEHLLTWANIYHTEAWGPLVGVYMDGTGGEDRPLVAEAWLPIPPDMLEMTHGDARVQVKRITPVRVAATVHRGFPDELGEALRNLLEWALSRELTRVTDDHRQVYRQAPPGHPDAWEVELQVPVRETESAAHAPRRPHVEQAGE